MGRSCSSRCSYSKTGVVCLHLKQTRSHRSPFLIYRLRPQMSTPVGIRPISSSLSRAEQKKSCSRCRAYDQQLTLQHFLSIPYSCCLIPYSHRSFLVCFSLLPSFGDFT